MIFLPGLGKVEPICMVENVLLLDSPLFILYFRVVFSPLEITGLHPLQVDLNDWSATRKTVESVLPIDLLVNNAGVFIGESFLHTTPESFDRSVILPCSSFSPQEISFFHTAPWRSTWNPCSTYRRQASVLREMNSNGLWPLLCTVLSRGVRSLFGPTRKSSPWGNFFRRWIKSINQA